MKPKNEKRAAATQVRLTHRAVLLCVVATVSFTLTALWGMRRTVVNPSDVTCSGSTGSWWDICATTNPALIPATWFVGSAATAFFVAAVFTVAYRVASRTPHPAAIWRAPRSLTALAAANIVYAFAAYAALLPFAVAEPRASTLAVVLFVCGVAALLAMTSATRKTLEGVGGAPTGRSGGRPPRITRSNSYTTRRKKRRKHHER